MFTNIRQFLGRHVENEKLVKKNKRTAAAELKRLEAASDDGLDASEIIWNECS